MHQDFTLLATITMAILTAFAGGYIARKLRLPSLVGYLLAGLVIRASPPVSSEIAMLPVNWQKWVSFL